MPAVLTTSMPQSVCVQGLGVLYLPLILELALLRQARRHARPRALPLYEAHQRRFLRFLSHVIGCASRNMGRTDGLVMGGTMMDLLDGEEGWLGLLFEGVRQFERGKGPLVGAGVVRNDLLK